MAEAPKPPAAPPPDPVAAPAPDMTSPEAAPPEVAPPAAPTPGSDDQPISSMTKGEFNDYLHDAIMNVIMTLMPDEGQAPADVADAGNEGQPEATQYEADEEGGIPAAAQAAVAEAVPAQLDKEDVDEEEGKRQAYAASEPGSGNVFIPGGTATACNGGGSPKKPKESRMERTVYEKEVNDLKTTLAKIDAERIKYANDLAETQEVILTLINDRNDAQLYSKRNQFKEELQAVMADGYVVDVDDELAAITLETAPEYNATRIGKIRQLHARSAANVRHTIPIGGVQPTSGNGRSSGIPTPEQAYEAANYAVQNSCSIPEAKRALGYTG